MKSVGGQWCGRAAATLTALLCAACGPSLMTLPMSAGSPTLDASSELAEATGECRAVTTFTAVVGVSGSIEGRPVRGTLLAGVARPASVRLEAVAPAGPPLFIFTAQDDNATLLLPREDRFVEHERPEAVLEAVAAIPMTAGELRQALTGCAAEPDPVNARGAGPDWRIVPDRAGDVYLHRIGQKDPWRLVAAIRRRSDRAGVAAWRAEYRDFHRGLPRVVRLTSVDRSRFDLRLVLSQVEIDVPLGADAFAARIPPRAAPMTVQELKDNGPLRR
jgi:hypothetical protein